jgi:hypothetical protein
MKFPNLSWAIARQHRAHYRAALEAGMSESRFSRCLSGRSQFAPEERRKLATCLGYAETWLFQEVVPPARVNWPAESSGTHPDLTESV